MLNQIVRRRLGVGVACLALPITLIIALIISNPLPVYSATGDISVQIDTQLVMVSSDTTDMVRVSDGMLLVAVGSAGSTGPYMSTWSVDSSGNIANSATDTLDGSSDLRKPSFIRRGTSNVFVVCNPYYGTSNIYLRTFTCSDAGDLSAAFIAGSTIETESGVGYITGVPLAGDYIALAYSTYGIGAKVRVIQVASDGTITNNNVETWTFDAAGGRIPVIVHVSGTKYAVSYSNWTSHFCEVFTLDISDAGDITPSEIDSLQYDVVLESRVDLNDCMPRFTWVRDTVYAVAYTQNDVPNNAPYLKTFTIDSSGNISNAVTDSILFAGLAEVQGYGLCNFGNAGVVIDHGLNNNNITSYLDTYPIDAAGDIKSRVGHTTISPPTIGTEHMANPVRIRPEKYISDNTGNTDTVQLYSYNITETSVTPPVVTSQAASAVNETTATQNGNITDIGGENNDYRGFVYDTSTHADPGNVAPASSGYASNWTENGSYGTGTFSHGISSLTQGYAYYFRACCHNSSGWDYSNTEQSFVTLPEGPSSFNATAASSIVINLTWSKGTGAVNTYIRGKDGSYPADRSDGYLVYNNTGTSTSDTGLTTGHTYYYRAWSWVSDTVYSDDYGQATAATLTISITLSPSSYGWGVVHASESHDTGFTYFTVTNNGTAAVDITIRGTDMTGGGVTWTLSDTAAPGDAIVGYYAGLEGGSYTIIVKKNTTYNTLKSNLAASGSQKFGVQIWTPTANLGAGVQVTGTITLTATEHT